MKNIEKLIEARVAQGRENLIFQLLGQFGDKLPEDVQVQMRKEAEDESRTGEKHKNYVKSRLV